MAENWKDVPFAIKLFQNIDESALRVGQAAMENCFINEAKGLTRFPGLKRFTRIPSGGRVHGIGEWRGSAVAVTDKGRFNLIDRDGTVTDKTGVVLSGGRRPILSKTDDALIAAAGAEIIKFDGGPTEILSRDAPLSSHVGYVDSYAVASEINSGRYYHTEPGELSNWPALNLFTANGRPDDINALFVTPYRELLLSGQESLEQWDRLVQGTTPFFRRFAVGEGVLAPYTMISADNATWFINRQRELVRSSGQTSAPHSTDIGKVLEKVDNWNGAWTGGFPDQPLNLVGQKFILFQIPNATNKFGTKGITYAYDYRRQLHSELFGWDAKLGRPTRWPGWCHYPLWDRVLVGMDDGVIAYFDENAHTNDGGVQRMLVRTAHIGDWGSVDVVNTRMRLRRGQGSNTVEPQIHIRCNRDNQGFGQWVRKSLGRAGDRFMVPEFGGFGFGNTFQFEIEITDDCPVEVTQFQADLEDA